jgi:hypothetical protein
MFQIFRALLCLIFPSLQIRFRVYSLQCTVCSVQFTVYSYSLQFVVHSLQCTVYSIQLHFTVYSVQYTVYSPHTPVFGVSISPGRASRPPDLQPPATGYNLPNDRLFRRVVI